MLLFAVEGRTGACALYECGCTDVVKRLPTGGVLVATNHYVAHRRAPSQAALDPSSSTLRRYDRLAALVGELAAQGTSAPVRDLIRALADDGVEVREGDIVTAYANVACPAAQEIWYTFGGYPAASRGDWQPVAWPW
jgi:hypothetical protein